jgi:hypothetical protein
MMKNVAAENAGEFTAETMLVLGVSRELNYSCSSTIPHTKSIG